ncbi:proline-rich nuclear receptor coactivator motif-containing protein [Aspergillus saccharolyticus JOP 1030-1]|uniref:Proteophosphoglycan 5 n=1 Tax=Aspergillus saccharolyticus JOP 1030-1 TaxID=1450539 RepID=A0A318Z057_9EURO|nr:hypothetical protein BP01DRAFT_204197 [Aspergillus saccharolyticus JOP 1030-1]PYH40661.1 hypothetical protein BP01DRAFT_204197 [Aspergillus saccharolyticus JOP 1030-1]
MPVQSPTPPTPKGPRNNRRNSKRNTIPLSQKVALLATPPSSPPRNQSPGGTATDSSLNNILSTTKKKQKHAHAIKKPRDASRASPVPSNGHRHTSSHSHISSTPQAKDGSHYAGPTFHASPAPSALPIPSFFSKSLPESDLSSGLDADNDNFDASPEMESTPSKSKARPVFENERRQSTPLDFLFKAAVEARNTQQPRSPDSVTRITSPHTDSKALPVRRSNGTGGGLFADNVDGCESHQSFIGPPFAASYKDRMDALRSASSPSPSTGRMDEDERRAKTEALKSLLLNPRPQKPSSASTTTQNQFAGFGEHYHSVPHFATPLRTMSGPPASYSHGISIEKKQALPGGDLYPQSSQTQPIFYQSQPSYSPLRKEVLSTKAGNQLNASGEAYYPPPHTYGQPRSPLKHAQYPLCYPPPQQSSVSRTVSVSPAAQSIDTKKMEDDLRRILKLDAPPGVSASGIRSSFA